MMPSNTPRPIETAPDGDGWILGLVQDGSPHSARQPWVIISRCDGGWMDDGGNGVEPSAWVPLPDPQPEPTGWRPAEGTIRIAHSVFRDDKGRVVPGINFSIYIVREDGSYDDYRDCDIASTIDDARVRAQRWADKIGLPIVEEPAPVARLIYSVPHETPQ